ncbi:hypothetical protein [Microbacterium luteolum]|uniref:hypothetical protein n=1 Tax=Microbacterium luteolum TaxID=69367 RepID=UPI0031E3BC33
MLATTPPMTGQVVASSGALPRRLALPPAVGDEVLLRTLQQLMGLVLFVWSMLTLIFFRR